jgi:hypothetical protein
MSEGEQKRARLTPARWWVIALVVALSGGAELYRILMRTGYGHSAAMFMGVPAVLAIVLALTPKAKTLTGGILKGITLALLIVAPVLGEGYLCILMASPLFYLVGAVVGIVLDESRKGRRATLSCIVLVLAPLSLEGVSPELSWNRTETVELVRVVNAPSADVERALGQPPRMDVALPRVLRIGFPHPLEMRGSGLERGATREILFSGAEGDPAGFLEMQVAEARPGYVRFDAVRDGSKLTQWIRWRRSEVQWAAVDPRHTRVLWRIEFDRELDPAWYFTPMERAAVSKAAEFLIEANATPARAEERAQ